MGIGILTSISIPLLYGFIEKVEVSVAKRYLRLAVRECQRQLIDGVVNPSFTKPPQSLGIIPTRRFQFPDSGNDGECLSPSSGNILTAARTLNTQTQSTYNININVVSGEKSTFSLKTINQMLKLSLESTKKISRLQEKVIGKI